MPGLSSKATWVGSSCFSVFAASGTASQLSTFGLNWAMGAKMQPITSLSGSETRKPGSRFWMSE